MVLLPQREDLGESLRLTAAHRGEGAHLGREAGEPLAPGGHMHTSVIKSAIY